MSGQPASLQDILSSLNDLTTEVRDVAALHFLLEDRLGPFPAPCLSAAAPVQPSSPAPGSRVPAFSYPGAPAEPGSCSAPVPRVYPASVPVPRGSFDSAPVPRASLDSAPVFRAPSLSAGSDSVVSSLPASSSAPVPRAPAPAFSSPASSGSGVRACISFPYSCGCFRHRVRLSCELGARCGTFVYSPSPSAIGPDFRGGSSGDSCLRWLVFPQGPPGGT